MKTGKIVVEKMKDNNKNKYFIIGFFLIICFWVAVHLFSARFYPQMVSQEDQWYVGAVAAAHNGTLTSYSYNWSYAGISYHTIYNLNTDGYGMIYIPLFFNLFFNSPLNSVIFTGMLFGVLFVISIYFLTFLFTQSRTTALLSMFILTILPSALYSNTFGRYEGESILPFFVCVLLILILKSQKNKYWLAPAGILCILLYFLWNGAMYIYGLLAMIAFYKVIALLFKNHIKLGFLFASASIIGFLSASIFISSAIVSKSLPLNPSLNPFDTTFQFLTWSNLYFNCAFIGLLAFPALFLLFKNLKYQQNNIFVYIMFSLMILGLYLGAGFPRWWQFTTTPIAILTSYMILWLYLHKFNIYTLLIIIILLVFATANSIGWISGISHLNFW